MDPLLLAVEQANAGRPEEARRLLSEMLTEAIANEQLDSLWEIEEACLKIAPKTEEAEARVKLYALAFTAALVSERAPRPRLTAEAFLYGTRARAFARALELAALAARDGDERERAEAAWVAAALERLDPARFRDSLPTSELELRRDDFDVLLRHEVRGLVVALARARDRAFWREQGLERAVATLEQGSERLRLRAQVDAVMLAAAEEIADDPATDPAGLSMLREMLG